MAVEQVLILADLRKRLADDEHLNPLPIYGSARMYDRAPVASSNTPSEKAIVVREYYNIPRTTQFNEEGC